jgi:spore maturation protein CgeB
LFHPLPEMEKQGDLVWIGNWGDDERSAELNEFLIEPSERLKLATTVRGVRYPGHARERLAGARIAYGGWIANADAPGAFAAHRVTVHVPRRPYTKELPGIPTIRMFEALACGIPLVSAPWDDTEGLFRPGRDFLFAQSGARMERHLRDVLGDPDLARSLAASGLETIAGRHTCRHRVDELFQILRRVGSRRVTEQLAATEPAQ